MKFTHAFAPRSLARAGGLNDASRSPPALHVLAGKLDSHLALALLSFLVGLVFFTTALWPQRARERLRAEVRGFNPCGRRHGTNPGRKRSVHMPTILTAHSASVGARDEFLGPMQEG